MTITSAVVRDHERLSELMIRLQTIESGQDRGAADQAVTAVVAHVFATRRHLCGAVRGTAGGGCVSADEHSLRRLEVAATDVLRSNLGDVRLRASRGAVIARLADAFDEHRRVEEDGVCCCAWSSRCPRRLRSSWRSGSPTGSPTAPAGHTRGCRASAGCNVACTHRCGASTRSATYWTTGSPHRRHAACGYPSSRPRRPGRSVRCPHRHRRSIGQVAPQEADRRVGGVAVVRLFGHLDCTVGTHRCLRQ